MDLLGPTRQDNKWQAQAKQGFAAQDFKVDWQKKQAICPQGKLSSSWSPAKNVYGQETVKIKFAQKDCIAGSADHEHLGSVVVGQTAPRLPAER